MSKKSMEQAIIDVQDGLVALEAAEDILNVKINRINNFRDRLYRVLLHPNASAEQIKDAIEEMDEAVIDLIAAYRAVATSEELLSMSILLLT